MSNVFRFHDGSDKYGWDNSNPLNAKSIAAIKDPDGEHASREITSIPSPFARIDLVNTAFKEVANHNDLDGETIYHKMVSDALDIGQILFNYDKYKDQIEIISWDPKQDLKNLLESTHKGHKALGKSLELFLKQDAETYNFNEMHKLYLINYKNGEYPINIIGGTSPASLFFTSANTYKLDGFIHGADSLFDDDYCALHRREDAFVEYIYMLKTQIPNFTTVFKNVNDYLEKVYPLLSSDLKKKINEITSTDYESLENLSLNGTDEFVEVLNTNLKKGKGNSELIKKSDFVLNSPKNLKENRPVLVLPNDTISGKFKYITDNWKHTWKANSYEDSEILSRKLPFDGSSYPYLTISDLLEPVIIRTPLEIDEYFFHKGGYNGDDSYLLPLKPLFFDYFDIDYLDGHTNGLKNFEIRPLSNNNIEVFLRLPIQNGKSITFKRIYYNPTSQANRPEFNEAKNEGAIIENKINLGISPFFKFPTSILTEYNIVLYDADSNPLMGDNNYQLNFYNSENQKTNLNQSTQRRFKNEENVNMFAFIINENFDYIQLKHKFGSGIIVPNFEKNLEGGVNQFTFAVDFGTTNTHIEYSENKSIAMPLEFSAREKRQIGSLINPDEYDESFLKLVHKDLLPNIIETNNINNFPQRTVMSYHRKTNFNQPVFSMGNISIPFEYEKGSFAINTEIKTNLKWNHDESSSEIMRKFFEQLIKMVRNKVLINNGNIDNTKIVWSYPASMMKFELNRLEQSWNQIIRKYLGENVEIIKVCESLTPFYYYINEQGKAALSKPIASIDIGGGTADVAIYQEERPSLFTSYKFAGDAIFGDNYNRNININGFVQKYIEKLNKLLNENGLTDLAGVMSTIRSRNNSVDAINALFSLDSNPNIQSTNLKISFLEALKDDNELKIIFLLFYSAHLYHLAELFKAKNLGIPAAISFSGTASKLLTILDSKENKFSTLKQIAKEIFNAVHGSSSEDSIDILLEENPKEIASKGAIYYSEIEEVNLDEIKEILINSQTLITNHNEITYSDTIKLEEVALENYGNFLKTFFEINNKISYRNLFGIDTQVLKTTQSFLERKKVDAMKLGIHLKKKELENFEDETISETFFFYPLVGSLSELAYEIVNMKNN